MVILITISSFLSFYTMEAHTIAGRHIVEGGLTYHIYWTSSPPGSLFPWPRGPGPMEALSSVNEVDTFIYRYLIKSWVLVGLSILAWIGTGLFILKFVKRRWDLKILA
jgi:hypothetical protein